MIESAVNVLKDHEYLHEADILLMKGFKKEDAVRSPFFHASYRVRKENYMKDFRVVRFWHGGQEFHSSCPVDLLFEFGMYEAALVLIENGIPYIGKEDICSGRNSEVLYPTVRPTVGYSIFITNLEREVPLDIMLRLLDVTRKKLPPNWQAPCLIYVYLFRVSIEQSVWCHLHGYSLDHRKKKDPESRDRFLRTIRGFLTALLEINQHNLIFPDLNDGGCSRQGPLLTISPLQVCLSTLTTYPDPHRVRIFMDLIEDTRGFFDWNAPRIFHIDLTLRGRLCADTKQICMSPLAYIFSDIICRMCDQLLAFYDHVDMYNCYCMISKLLQIGLKFDLVDQVHPFFFKSGPHNRPHRLRKKQRVVDVVSNQFRSMVGRFDGRTEFKTYLRSVRGMIPFEQIQLKDFTTDVDTFASVRKLQMLRTITENTVSRDGLLAFCQPRSIPRVGMKSALGALPKEILRVVKEFLMHEVVPYKATTIVIEREDDESDESDGVE